MFHGYFDLQVSYLTLYSIHYFARLFICTFPFLLGWPCLIIQSIHYDDGYNWGISKTSQVQVLEAGWTNTSCGKVGSILNHNSQELQDNSKALGFWLQLILSPANNFSNIKGASVLDLKKNFLSKLWIQLTFRYLTYLCTIPNHVLFTQIS